MTPDGSQSSDDWLRSIDQETLDVLLAAPAVDLTDLVEARRRAAERALLVRELLPRPPEVSVRDVLIAGEAGAPGIRVRLYEPADRDPAGGVAVFVHGGGMVLGSAEDSDPLCERLALEHGCLWISVDYRLAPETPAPGAAEDVVAALRWTAEAAEGLGVDPSRIVLVGASAGGGIAAGATILNTRLRGPQIALLMLIFPMLDDRGRTPSAQWVTDERTWNRDANLRGWQAALGDACGSAAVPATCAPARVSDEDLHEWPPTYIDVGDHDLFRDEDIAFAQRLMQAGVPCELHVTPGAWHGSEYAAPDAGSSQRILRARREALERALAPS